MESRLAERFWKSLGVRFGREGRDEYKGRLDHLV